MSCIVQGRPNYVNFSIDYLIRTICLLSRVLHNTPPHLRLQLLQTQDLHVSQVDEPCIGLTQENSIENFVLDCLPYILNPHGPYYYYFSLP